MESRRTRILGMAAGVLLGMATEGTAQAQGLPGQQAPSSAVVLQPQDERPSPRWLRLWTRALTFQSVPAAPEPRFHSQHPEPVTVKKVVQVPAPTLLRPETNPSRAPNSPYLPSQRPASPGNGPVAQAEPVASAPPAARPILPAQAEVLPPPRPAEVSGSGGMPNGGVVSDPIHHAPLTTHYSPTEPAPLQLSRWQRWKLRLQECFLGFRGEFEAPPLGYWLYLHNKTQVANGEAARMVLYRYDFVEGSDQLKLRGQDQLAKIAALLPQNFYPIVIERTPEAPGLAEARRLRILEALAASPFPVPPERVVIGPPIANGLRGVEAVLINGNLLNQTLNGPITPDAGGFDTSGIVGGATPITGGVGGPSQ